MRQGRFGRAGAVALVTLAGLAGTAIAGVDAAVGGNAKIAGSIDPDGEVEILRFEATAESVLVMKIAAKKKAPLDFTISVFDPDGAPIPLDRAPKLVDRDSKIVIKKLPLARSGSYRVEISAKGSGEYAAKLKVTPAKKIERSVAIKADDVRTTTIAAPPGSKLTITASAPKGETTLPRIDAVGGIDVSGLPGPKGSRHTIKLTLDDQGGDLVVDLSNTSSSEGDVTLQATIKPPRVKVQKLDVRGISRGAPGGNETVVIRPIGVDGGVIEVVDGDSPLDGLSLVVPPGALDVPTGISASTVFLPVLPNADQQQAAGEPVEFGPDGLQFAEDATLVIPFDVSSLPVNANLGELRVMRIASDGSTELLIPLSVDVQAGTMTAAVSGFSIFVPVVPRGTPNIAGSDYWFLSQQFAVEPDLGGTADSRSRVVDQQIGTLSFGAPGPQGFVSITEDDRAVTWTHDQDGIGSFPVSSASSGTDTGTWDYGLDGQTISIGFGAEPPEVLALSQSGDFLLAGTDDVIDNPGEVGFAILLRREPSATLAGLAGSYHLAGSEVGAFGEVGIGPLQVSVSRFFGTLEIRANGTFTVRVTERYTDFDPQRGSFGSGVETFREGGDVRLGTTADGPLEGALILSFDPEPNEEAGDTFAFLPSVGGRVMVATDQFALGGGQLFFVAVRESSATSKSALGGTYRSTSTEVVPSTYETIAQSQGPVTIGDFEVCGYVTDLDFDGNGHGTETFFAGVCFGRDPAQVDGIFQFPGSGSGDPEDAIAVNVASNGKLTSPDSLGAMTADGEFFMDLLDPRDNSRDLEVVFGVRLPPSAFNPLPLRED